MSVHNWNDALPFVAPEKSEPVLECDEATVKCLFIEPGEQAKPHIHQSAVDIMLIARGTGIATVNGQQVRVGPGDVILNPPGTVHGIRNDSDERLVWVVIQSPPINRRTLPEKPHDASSSISLGTSAAT